MREGKEWRFEVSLDLEKCYCFRIFFLKLDVFSDEKCWKWKRLKFSVLDFSLFRARGVNTGLGKDEYDY